MPADIEFVARMSGALSDAGLPRMPSRVFAALLVDDDGRMTAAELADHLRCSAGSVSEAVRYLEGIGMIRRERTAGQRYDTYVVDTQAWHDATLSVETRYAPMIAALDAELDVLDAHAPARERLEVSRDFLCFMERELSTLADRWAARTRARP